MKIVDVMETKEKNNLVNRFFYGKEDMISVLAIVAGDDSIKELKEDHKYAKDLESDDMHVKFVEYSDIDPTSSIKQRATLVLSKYPL